MTAFIHPSSASLLLCPRGLLPLPTPLHPRLVSPSAARLCNPPVYRGFKCPEPSGKPDGRTRHSSHSFFCVFIASHFPSSSTTRASLCVSAPRLAPRLGELSVYVWFVRGGTSAALHPIRSTIHSSLRIFALCAWTIFCPTGTIDRCVPATPALEEILRLPVQASAT